MRQQITIKWDDLAIGRFCSGREFGAPLRRRRNRNSPRRPFRPQTERILPGIADVYATLARVGRGQQ